MKNYNDRIDSSKNNKASLNSPSDVAFSKVRNFYVVPNLGNNTVTLIDASTLQPKITYGIPNTNNSKDK